MGRSRIVVAGGQGGAGCVSFFRDTRTQFGGPDGGPGGDGGSVIIRASSKVLDLARDRYTYIAGSGLNGKGGSAIGRAGPNVVVEVPVGTLVKVFPETEGFLGPEAVQHEKWARAPGHARKDRRNRQLRIKEVDDDMQDTEVSSYMQQLESNDNRKTSAPAGPRPSKFQRGKGALHRPGTAHEEDADDLEPDDSEPTGDESTWSRRGGRPPLGVGRQVQVKLGVEEPEYGWGRVQRSSIGVLVAFDQDRDVVVNFPEQEGWVGRWGWFCPPPQKTK